MKLLFVVVKKSKTPHNDWNELQRCVDRKRRWPLVSLKGKWIYRPGVNQRREDRMFPTGDFGLRVHVAFFMAQKWEYQGYKNGRSTDAIAKGHLKVTCLLGGFSFEGLHQFHLIVFVNGFLFRFRAPVSVCRFAVSGLASSSSSHCHRALIGMLIVGVYSYLCCTVVCCIELSMMRTKTGTNGYTMINCEVVSCFKIEKSERILNAGIESEMRDDEYSSHSFFIILKVRVITDIIFIIHMVCISYKYIWKNWLWILYF